MRGRVEAGPQPAAAQDRFGQRRNAPLAVGACDVEDLVGKMRIAESAHQRADTVESKVDGLDLVPSAVEEPAGLPVIQAFGA